MKLCIKNCKPQGWIPLYDDRNERAGAKFATMDLIGLPWRITVGPRGLEKNTVELTNRRSGETQDFPADKIVAHLAAHYAPLFAAERAQGGL